MRKKIRVKTIRKRDYLQLTVSANSKKEYKVMGKDQ